MNSRNAVISGREVSLRVIRDRAVSLETRPMTAVARKRTSAERRQNSPFSKKLINQYNELYPGEAKFTAGSACSGLYRGMKLWEAAVNEAGSLKQDDVIEALDHAKIAEGPGGPAEMVPGQHHVRLNMYIAQANNGNFRIVKSLGVVDPKEADVPRRVEFASMSAAGY